MGNTLRPLKVNRNLRVLLARFAAEWPRTGHVYKTVVSHDDDCQVWQLNPRCCAGASRKSRSRRGRRPVVAIIETGPCPGCRCRRPRDAGWQAPDGAAGLSTMSRMLLHKIGGCGDYGSR
jgi:hypothetical protein